MNSSTKAKLRDAIWNGEVPRVPSVIKSEQRAVSLIEGGEAALSEKVKALKERAVCAKTEAKKLGAAEASKRIKRLRTELKYKANADRKELKKTLYSEVKRNVQAPLAADIEQLKSSFNELVAGLKASGLLDKTAEVQHD